MVFKGFIIDLARVNMQLCTGNEMQMIQIATKTCSHFYGLAYHSLNSHVEWAWSIPEVPIINNLPNTDGHTQGNNTFLQIQLTHGFMPLV